MVAWIPWGKQLMAADGPVAWPLVELLQLSLTPESPPVASRGLSQGSAQPLTSRVTLAKAFGLPRALASPST